MIQSANSISQEDKNISNAFFKDVLVKRRFALMIAASTIALIAVLALLWFTVLAGRSDGLFTLYCLGAIGSVLVCVAALLLARKEIAVRPERICLVFLLALTCTSSWIYDTNQVSWDVAIHFGFMDDYATLDGNHEFTEAEALIRTGTFDGIEDERWFADIIESMGVFDEDIDYKSISGGALHDTELLKQKDDILNRLDEYADDKGRVGHASFFRLFSRVASLPASVVYLLCTFLSLPFAAKYVIAKMTYAILYSLIMYFGMKRLRSGKLLFAIIAMYPTCIFITANYNYDYWVIAWVMYATAFIVGILQRPEYRMCIPDMLKILAAFVFGLAPKAIYFPLVLLALLVPKNRFSNAKQCHLFRLAVLFAMLVLVASFVVPFFFVGTPTGDSRGGAGVNALGQMHFILAQPLEYAGILAGFLWEYLSVPATAGYINHAAYLEYGPVVVWITFLILTIFATITDTRYNNQTMANWRYRLIVIGLVLMTLVLATTALYVSFTPVANSTIEGFQPRYMLPLLFPLLVFMGSRKTHWPRRRKVQNTYYSIVFALVLGANWLTIWAVYLQLLS